MISSDKINIRFHKKKRHIGNLRTSSTRSSRENIQLIPEIFFNIIENKGDIPGDKVRWDNPCMCHIKYSEVSLAPLTRVFTHLWKTCGCKNAQNADNNARNVENCLKYDIQNIQNIDVHKKYYIYII